MITDPQIFIIYEPGMFGTFMCNMFLSDSHKDLKLKSDHNSKYNAHNSLYKDTLDNFHNDIDYEELKNKDLTLFFSSLENKGLSVHRLCTWEYLNLKYSRYFSNYVIGLISADESNLDRWAFRSLEAAGQTPANWPNTEWWHRNVKDLDKVPEYFKKAMGLKERQKHLKNQYESLKNMDLNNDRIIKFDVDKLTVGNIQKFCNDCCDAVGVPNTNIAIDQANGFLEKNKMLFDKQYK